MPLCDVCAGSEARHLVGGTGFGQAVRDGYNPFAMGVSGPTLEEIASRAEASGADPSDLWRTGHAARHQADWQVCDGCLPALRPFLDRKAGPAPGLPGKGSACSRCGNPNPASQWHCSHCGNIQWSLIGFSVVVGAGMVLWGATLATWWTTGTAWAVAVLLLWIAIGSIREGLRARRDL